MTRYTVASRRKAGREDQETPAIWRAIGCFMIVFVPVLSFALASWTLQAAVDNKWPIPYQLVGFPVLPPALLKVYTLAPLWDFLQAQPNLYGVVALTILYIVVIGAVVSFGYALVYRFTGPPRYGPLDAPPPRVTAKRYKR